MKTKLTVLFFILFSSNLFAQSDKQAEKMITDFIKSVKESAIQMDFEMNVYDQENELNQTQKGTFTMKNDKFSLLMHDVHIFFDGKTQWAYVASSNEVSITEPLEDELTETNPIFILQEYQNKSTITFSSDNKSPENYIIKMVPLIDSDFSKIVAEVNKSTKNLVSLNLSGKNGFSVSIVFSNFRQGLNISDNVFTFDKNKYEDVFENDLR